MSQRRTRLVMLSVRGALHIGHGEEPAGCSNQQGVAELGVEAQHAGGAERKLEEGPVMG